MRTIWPSLRPGLDYSLAQLDVPGPRVREKVVRPFVDAESFEPEDSEALQSGWVTGHPLRNPLAFLTEQVVPLLETAGVQ
jgi:hypothetical protein